MLMESKKSRNTGGPRNSRTFYMRIRLFAVNKSIPDLRIREFCYVFPRSYAIFDRKSVQKPIKNEIKKKQCN
jgi:hypothetical protein